MHWLSFMLTIAAAVTTIGCHAEDDQAALAGLVPLGAVFEHDDDGRIVRISIRDVTAHEPAEFNDALRYLQGFPGLEAVVIQNAPIDASGMEHIAELSNLTELDLSFTSTTDDDLEHLAPLTRLSRLVLDKTKVTNDGLAKLAPLQSLKHLNLSGTQITDDGLQHLAAIESLEELNLSRTHVTDNGVHHLQQIESLKKLSLLKTKVSSRAVIQLRRVFPELDLIAN